MNQLNRRLVIIASTMRSGSTLLKALLGEAHDVSNLKEVNFQKFARPKADWTALWQMAPERILVLKRPGWYNELGSYPSIPKREQAAGGPTQIVVLVRDVYDTVESLRRMTFGRFQNWTRTLSDHWLAQKYWLGITSNIVRLSEEESQQCCLVRYEDLVANPIKVTAELYSWIGSERQTGTDTYQKPVDGRWRWGVDDNSPQIRSLHVQPSKPRPRDNQRLVDLIDQSGDINDLRKKLGYVSG